MSTPSGNRLLTALALWKTAGDEWIFAADNGGTSAWKVSGAELLPRWRSPRAGTSPVVANGMLFVYDPRGGLVIYDAVSGRRITELACGPGHWNSPIVADGRVALPEGNANSHRTAGVLDIWRLR